MIGRTIVACALAFGLAVLVAACGDDAPRNASTESFPPEDGSRSWSRCGTTDDGAFAVWWRLAGDGLETLPDAEPFDLEVKVTDAHDDPAEVELRFDAEMPHHGHGMNVVPRVERTAPGQFVVHGVLLHMGGRWEWMFDLTPLGSAVTERVQCTVEAP